MSNGVFSKILRVVSLVSCCRVVLALFVVYLMFSLGCAYAEPSPIGTTTSPQATAAARKSFYDMLNHVHWVFWYNGATISYAKSADGANWVDVGTLSYDTPNFTVTFKEISGTSYVVLATLGNSYDIIVRRGVLSSTTVSFDSEVTAFNGTTSADTYLKPSVTIDGSNNVWVAAIHDNGVPTFTRYQVRAIKSASDITSALSSWGSVFYVSRRVGAISSISLIPQSSNKVYLIQSHDSGNVVGYTFDGTSWSSANTGGDYSWFSFGTVPLDGIVRAIVEINGDIYVGGQFSMAGSNFANNVAKYSGGSWSALGSGVNGYVFSMKAVGSDLYVGGSFTTAGGVTVNSIAKWNGASWSALGSGTNSTVTAIGEISGNIFVGGLFTTAGGITVNYIAKWDGSNWSALGSGMNARVYALANINSDLYAGGLFTTADGLTVNGIAKWNGSSWSALGSGVYYYLTSDQYVKALTTIGTDLYVGGHFSVAGGISAACIAKWDGSSWSALGTGVGIASSVNALTSIDNNLYAGGSFAMAGGVVVNNIAKWDGSSWSALGAGVNDEVLALLASSNGLYAGGRFITAGADTANCISKWNGSSWISFNNGINGSVRAIIANNNDIYIGGDFSVVNNVTANRVAKWDGVSWSALGAGITSSGVTSIYSLAMSNNNLYVGGYFSSAAGIASNCVAKWNGTSWSALGSGMSSGTVYALYAVNDTLYAGGSFTTAGGVTVNRIAKWDGSSWFALGTGANDQVHAITMIGSDLYIGGNFTTVDGVAASYIAKYNGSAWSALGSGMSGGVYGLATMNNNLYACGSFNVAGGVTVNKIAKWGGSSWSALGSGLAGTAYSITATSSEIYVGGSLSSAGGSPVNRIAKWNGSAWSALGSGINATINVVFAKDDDLYVGNSAQALSDSNYFARWSPAIAANVGLSSSMSAVNDASGDVHVIYTDSIGALAYRKFDNALNAWSVDANLAEVSIESPSLALDSTTGALYAFWEWSNALYYRKGVAPFATSDWESVNLIYNTGTNQNINAEPNDGFGGMLVSWTGGNSSPYTVYSDTILIEHAISGIITDDSNALSGVTVNGGALGSTTTALDGAYSFTTIPHGTAYTLTVSRTGYTFGTSTASGNLTSNATHDFTGTLNTYTISGTITDGSNALSGVTVNGGALGSTTTALDGAYSFTTIPHGTAYTLTVSRTGYTFGTSTASGTLTSNATHDFTGTLNTYTISGTITDDSNALSGVTVNGGALGSTTTALDGAYSFTTIPHGTAYTLTVSRTGYTFGTSTASGTLTSNATHDFTGTLNTYTISGTITDGTEPLVDATIVISGGISAQTTTNSLGTYSFANIPYGIEYTLRPTKDTVSFVPEILTGTVAGNIVANFTATVNNTQTGVTISGQIMNNGQPVADATVSLIISGNSVINSTASEHRMITDINGAYEFNNVETGTYNLVAQKNDVTIATNSINIDGTNSNTTVDLEVREQTALCATTYALWNGYLKMQNVLELKNKGEIDLVANVSVFDLDQQTRHFTKRGTHNIVVPKHEERDMFLNSLAEFKPDSYGFAEITTNHNLFDGSVTYYRNSESVDSQFDYAFTLPFANTLTGCSYMLFNTHYPTSGQGGADVLNWLTVVNPNETVFNANVIYYAEDGTSVRTTTIKVPAKSRIDFDGGHGVLGQNRAGLIEFIPQDNHMPYVAALIRYGMDYSFAFGKTAKLGTGSEQLLPITNIESRFGFFEVANTSNARAELTAKWYNADGKEIGNVEHRIKPKSIIHFATEQLLPVSSAGMLVFTSDVPQSLVGQMVVYEHDSDFAKLKTVEYSQASAAFGSILSGSYNLYLGMNNWLRVFNVSEQQTSFTLLVADKELTMTLEPHARRDIAIHELAIPKDTYGTLTLTATTPSSIVAQALRVKDGEFITTSAVR